jgi:hypothetical protein
MTGGLRLDENRWNDHKIIGSKKWFETNGGVDR